MASTEFAKVLQRNSWRLTTILVYAVLEWMLIFLLIISALFQFITTKFASFFGLHPPCLWCSRLDHILEPKEPDFYRKLICDRHAREISLLGYCSTHRKLAEADWMCEECTLSRPTQVTSAGGSTESNPHWVTCMSMVASMGLDLSQKGDAKGLPMDGHGHMETSNNGWVSNKRCSCCNSPLDDKLYSQSFFKTILINGQKGGILKPQWHALEYAANGVGRVLEGRDGLENQSECACRTAEVKISEEFLHSRNESDVGSSVSDGETEHEEPKLESSISLIEHVEDILDTRFEDEASDLSRSLEVVQADDDGVGVGLPSDIYVDKRIAYRDTVTQGYASVPNATLNQIAFEDTAGEENLKQAGFVPPGAIASNSKTICAGGAENLAGSTVLDSENIPADGVPRETLPLCLEESTEILEMPLEKEAIDWVASEGNVSDMLQATQEDSNEDAKGHGSDGTVTLPEHPPLKVDDEGAGVIGEEGDEKQSVPRDIELPQAGLHMVVQSSQEEMACRNDEVQFLKDSEADGKRRLDEHPSPVSSVEMNANSCAIASAEVGSLETMQKIPEAMDVDLKGEESVTSECQGSMEIEDDQTCNLDGEGVFDQKVENGKPQENGKPISTCFSDKSLDRVESETDHCARDGVDHADEDKASEAPESVEGIHLLHKRLIIERKDSGAESLDGSVLSEIEGEFVVERLKRALENERKALNSLYAELEEERSASAIAANQTMAMITRLQEEKAAVQMEALQYQRMMEEQSEYDQEALQLLNEILVKREKEKQELEKEVDLYRKRLLRYEAKERRIEKRKVEDGECSLTAEKGDEIDSCLEVANNEQDQTPDNQSRRIRTSSTSSMSDGSEEICSDVNEVDDHFDLQQSSQNTPAELTMSAGRGYEDSKQKCSLDESLADFEEERLSILEQLKVLEEKLHTLADAECIESELISDISSKARMVHPEANVVPEEPSKGVLTEDYSMQLKTEGDDESLSVHPMQDDLKESHVDKETLVTVNGNSNHSLDNGIPIERRVAGAKAKRLLPLFDATSFDGDSLQHTEDFSPADPSNDWRTVSMVARDNNRLAIEEEVYHVYERLQALEADREFFKHSIKSLKKGDEGMKLLQEIAQHLRDLRNVELKARNFNDTVE